MGAVKAVGLSVVKDEVPFLNFAALQNAITTMETATNSLSELLGNNGLTTDKKNEINKKLYNGFFAFLGAIATGTE